MSTGRQGWAWQGMAGLGGARQGVAWERGLSGAPGFISWEKVGMGTTIKMGAVRAELEASAEVVQAVRDLLTVDHPGARHVPAFKMGRWDGKIRFTSAPKFAKTKEARTLTFPAGLTRRVLDKLAELGEDFSLHDEMPKLKYHELVDNPAGCLRGVTLRDYQVKTVKHALQTGRLAIQCPTGSGKTEIGAALVQLSRLPTLWLVHRKELLHQTFDRLTSRLDDNRLDGSFVSQFVNVVGMVGAGEFYSGYVTVAMVQTLANLSKTDDFWEQWGMVIVDEVHHLSAETWYDIVAQCKLAHFRFGLSGTIVTGHPVRDMKLEGATGPLYVAAKTMELAEQGFLAKPLISMVDIGSQHYPSYASVREEVCPTWRDNPRQLSTLGGKLFATAYKRGITDNTKRNEEVTDLAVRHAERGEKVLVLFTRIPHGKKLLAQVKGFWRSTWLLHGSEDDSTRQIVLKRFKAYQEGAVLIASNIFDEGVDIPEVSVLIVAGGGESYTKNIQRVGRALRPKQDKDYVLIYDFLDGRDPTDEKDYLAKHTLSRIQDYKGQGFQVKRAKI